MGKIVVLEGMSGTGKDTHLKHLEIALKDAYVDLKVLIEPSTGFLRNVIKEYKSRELRDPYVEFDLFQADRRDQYNLNRQLYENPNTLILQGRSKISTIAYQGIMQKIPVQEILDRNIFFPQIDLPLILLADPQVAYDRILKRHQETGEPISKSETLEGLKKVRDAYLKATDYIANTVIINADGTPEEVYSVIKQEVTKKLGYLKRGIFIDKDGTIVDNSGYPKVVPSFEILNSAVEGIKLSSQVEGLKIIVSNQPLKGKKTTMTLDQVDHNLAETKRKFEHLGGKLDDIFYCTESDDNHPDKKPNPGMIEKAIQKYHLDRESSWIVGDSLGDMLAGKNARIKKLLVLCGHNTERKESDKELADVVKENFTEAMHYLKEH